MGTPIARVTDRVAHPLPGILQPGPGSTNVIVGFLPAWRGVPALAAAALSAAKAVSDATVNAAKVASTAAMGTPGAPAAKLAEEAVKAAALAAMTSLMNSAKAASTSASGGSPDIHICATFPPTPAHGPGMVLDGNPTVLINGLPACQVGDKVTEALGPPDPIIMGKTNVIIGENGGGAGGGGGLAALLAAAAAAAAALVDFLADVIAAVKAIVDAVIDAAKALGQAIAGAIKNGATAIFNYFKDHLLFDGDWSYTPGVLFGGNWSDGLFGHIEGKGGVGLYKDEGAGHWFESFPYIGGYWKANVLTVEGKGDAGVGFGAGASGNVKGTGAGAEGGLLVGSDINNPWYQFGFSATAGQAEATATSLAGYDGNRIGVAAEGKAAADALAGDLKQEINVPIPFTNWTISSRAKAGATAYSAGAGAEGHGYYDTKSGRFHMGGEGEAAIGGGLGIGIDLSIGPRYDSRDRVTSY